jgi:hypothetical protein
VVELKCINPLEQLLLIVVLGGMDENPQEDCSGTLLRINPPNGSVFCKAQKFLFQMFIRFR